MARVKVGEGRAADVFVEVGAQELEDYDLVLPKGEGFDYAHNA